MDRDIDRDRLGDTRFRDALLVARPLAAGRGWKAPRRTDPRPIDRQRPGGGPDPSPDDPEGP